MQMAAIVKLFTMVLALIGPAPADSPKQFQLKPGEQIVAIGDSITAEGGSKADGYLRDIDAVLAKQYPDKKFPRWSTRASAARRPRTSSARFDKDVVKIKPAYVTISIGINDVWHRLGAPHDEKVLAEYKKNVATMVDAAQKAGIKVILLTPTVISEDADAEGNKRLVKYIEAEKQIAAEKKCQLVDLHAMFLTALKKKPAKQEHLADARRRSHAAAGRYHHGGRRVAGPGRAGREDRGLRPRDEDRQEMSPRRRSGKVARSVRQR